MEKLPTELIKLILCYCQAKDLHQLTLCDKFCAGQIMRFYKSLGLLVYESQDRSNSHILEEMTLVYQRMKMPFVALQLIRALKYELKLTPKLLPQTKRLLSDSFYRINSEPHVCSHQTAIYKTILIRVQKESLPNIAQDTSDPLEQRILSTQTDSLQNCYVATTDMHSHVNLYNVPTGKHICNYSYSKSAIKAMIYVPTLQLLIFGGIERVVFVCDLFSGKLHFKLSGHTNMISCLTTITDENGDCYLLSASLDGKLLRWNLSHNLSQQANARVNASDKNIPILTHNHPIRSMIARDQDYHLYLGDSEGNILCFDYQTFQTLWTIKAHLRITQTILLHPISFHLFSAGDDGTVKIWDPETQQCLQTINIGGFLVDLAFLTNSQQQVTNKIIVSTLTQNVKIWNYETNQLVKTLSDLHSGFVTSILPINEELLISSTCSPEIRLHCL